MKAETKIRNALISLYWNGHDDGRLCEASDDIMGHITGEDWSRRRKQVIDAAIKRILSADKKQKPKRKTTA